jgi:ubiquitin
MAAPEFFAHVTDTQFRSWILKGRSPLWIARVTGLSVAEVKARKAQWYQDIAEKAKQPLPTPEEIEQRAAECRAKWSDSEWQRQECRQPVEVTVVPESSLTSLVPGRR